jgi:YegS/Rv2252/BmrU family lipid kinase
VSENGRYLLIVNPSSGSGRGRELLPEVERQMRARRLDFGTVITTSLEHGVAEAQAAMGRGETPVVMSGDGLIGQIGGALAETGATMGIVPGGRGNDFARVLGIPTEPAEAVSLLAEGPTREVDVGEVNGKRFLCIASIGFESIANRIANENTLLRGELVYLYAGLRTLATWKPARFTIKLDGEPTAEYEGYSVQVANSRAYGGGFFIAPNAELDDGVFDVVMVGDSSKLSFLSGMPKAKKGTHVEQEQVNVERAAEVEVSADRPFAVYADGEHLADLPARLRVLKGALRVVAPPGALVGPPDS